MLLVDSFSVCVRPYSTSVQLSASPGAEPELQILEEAFQREHREGLEPGQADQDVQHCPADAALPAARLPAGQPDSRRRVPVPGLATSTGCASGSDTSSGTGLLPDCCQRPGRAEFPELKVLPKFQITFMVSSDE